MCGYKNETNNVFKEFTMYWTKGAGKLFQYSLKMAIVMT